MTDDLERRALAEASEQEPSPLAPPIKPDPTRLPGEGSLWVKCRAYRAHRLDHRRNAAGVWICPICQPATVDR